MAEDCNLKKSQTSTNNTCNAMIKVPGSCKKKSWLELKQAVRAVRRQLYAISSKIPTYFSFYRTHDEYGTPWTQLFFLSTLANGRETTLLYVTVPESPPPLGAQLPTLPWQSVLEPNFQALLPGSNKNFSREEQLQWERKRLIMWGITAYDFHAESGRFVFPACGSLFHCGGSSQSPPFYPQELSSPNLGARLNPTLCPWNPDLVAYVYNSDIWVYHVGSGVEERLTFARKVDFEPISAGIPSYVTQEEFNRYIGFWWQPLCFQGDGVYRILYEEVDESDVEILHLPSYTEERGSGGLEEFRFPRAGSPNAQSFLKMVTFTVSPAGKIENISTLILEEPLNLMYSKYEYLVRAGWTDDGRHVWAQLLDRKQNCLQLILIPPSSFTTSSAIEEGINHTAVVASSPRHFLLCQESSSIWINVHDVLIFLAQENPQEISFIWASEETGFRHLYLVTAFLYQPETSGIETVPQCTKVPLTSGNWEVSDKDVWFDHHRGLVYFIGLKDTPLEKHLYVVSLDHPGDIFCLTAQGYNHIIFMDDDCRLAVDTSSNISSAPQSQVCQIVISSTEPRPLASQVELVPLAHLLEPHPSVQASNDGGGPHPSLPHPELFTYQLRSGHLVYGMVFRPAGGIVSGVRYPTVLTVYGGPEVQTVANTYKGMRHLRQHLLASQGYVVVSVDCRGSRHRGLAFESHIKFRMGTVEIADQVEVLQGLAESTGYIDLKRVAVHGWSYGGYLSLMALAQRPDIFKVAVAGAPVTSWELYDTGYTERYMSTPAENPQGYHTGSVLTYVPQFPDEENRLLIMHGLMDENVHFSHTAQLVAHLVKAGKPYQLQVYPSERHSLRHLDASEHYETMLLSFLQNHL